MDSEILKSEPITHLALVSFGNNGVVTRCTSIPSIPDEYVKEMVRLFLASVSISTGFWKATEPDDIDTAHPNEPVTQPNNPEKATFVSCNPDILIIAEPLHSGHSPWVGLVGKPLASLDVTIVNQLLPALRETANSLSVNARLESEENITHALWERVCFLVSNDNLWSTKQRVIYLRDSLVAFGKARAQGSSSVGPDTVASRTGEPLLLTKHSESFREAVNRAYDTECLPLCVFSPQMEPVYAAHCGDLSLASVAWYYTSLLNIGFRGFGRDFFENHDGDTVRLWYKKNGWVLFTRFLSSSNRARDPSRAIRNAAYELMRTVAAQQE